MSGPHDEPCRVCARPVGDHLVWELQQCTAGHELAYEDMPERIPFRIDDRDIGMADHVIARALVAEVPFGRLPVLLLTFEVTVPGRTPGQRTPTLRPVAEVGLILDPAHMRKAGTIIRDAANGAANRAEGKR
jgi:hypothetical protein